MGMAMRSVRRFFVRRKTSIVKTRLKRIAEKVTPQRIGGRVTATKSTSAVSPALRSLTSSHSEHAADPSDDLRRTERDRYSNNRADAPAPRHSICHRHAAQNHDENDRDGHQPGENIGLQSGGAGEERRGLSECQLRQ